MKIRFATVDDIGKIINLGREIHDESTFSGMDYSGDIVRQTLTNLINERQFVVIAEDLDGAVIGAMIGYASMSWFGKDYVANDLSLAVRGDRRGGFIAYNLVKHFVKWARLAGAKQIRPSVATGNRNADSLYERLGFERCGSTYLMEGV